MSFYLPFQHYLLCCLAPSDLVVVFDLLHETDPITRRLQPLYSVRLLFSSAMQLDSCNIQLEAHHIYILPEGGGCLLGDLRLLRQYSLVPQDLTLHSLTAEFPGKSLTARPHGRLVAVQPDYGVHPVLLFDAFSRRLLARLPPCNEFHFLDSQRGLLCLHGGVYHVEFFGPRLPSPTDGIRQIDAPTLDIGLISGSLPDPSQRRVALLAVQARYLSREICRALGVGDMSELTCLKVQMGYAAAKNCSPTVRDLIPAAATLRFSSCRGSRA